MTTEQDTYWLKSPYMVLFDLLHLHRVKPWDVNLSQLLTGLMKEMKGRGFIDFSVSGTALLSSAVLLRMKSELVLKMEEPPRPPPEKPTDYVPPPLAFPIRFQSTTTSLDEVLKGILDVLKAERLLPSETAQLVSRTPAVFEQADDWLGRHGESCPHVHHATLSRHRKKSRPSSDGRVRRYSDRSDARWKPSLRLNHQLRHRGCCSSSSVRQRSMFREDH